MPALRKDKATAKPWLINRTKARAMFFFSSLYKELYSDANLNRAWRAVRRASTATGLDGMTATHFEARAFILLKQLQEDLRAFRYRPQPVKRIFMKREIGPPRPLGIPTFIDRIVQRGLVQTLIPIFEPHFDDCSHAYRTGRSPQTALAQARAYAQSGCAWVVKLDLSDCFGNIPHRPLLRAVFRRVKDCAVRRLLARMLSVEIVTESNSGMRQVSKPERGILQGSPLSPLLANIYLDTFDQALRKLDLRFVRYGDDIAIFLSTKQEAEATLEIAARLLEKMHMPINREKTKVHHLGSGFKYLGEWFRWRKEKRKAS